MAWMNRWEVEDAVREFAQHPVLGPASLTLRSLMDEVDAHSDGWAYWQAPTRAAERLMAMCEPHMPHESMRKQWTVKDYTTALTPIKAFITRKGAKAGLNVTIHEVVTGYQPQ